MSGDDDDDVGGGRRRRCETLVGRNREHATLGRAAAAADSSRRTYGSVAAAAAEGGFRAGAPRRDDDGDGDGDGDGDDEAAPMLPPPGRGRASPDPRAIGRLVRGGGDDDGCGDDARPRGSWWRRRGGGRKKRRRRGAPFAPPGLVAVLLVAAAAAPRSRRALLDLAASLASRGGGEERRIRIASFDAQLALGELQALADSATSSSFVHPGKKKKKQKNRKEKVTRPPPDGCEGTILILRHCEKDTIEEHCDYVGFERAHYLPHLFGMADGAVIAKNSTTTRGGDRGAKGATDKKGRRDAEAAEGARRRKEDHDEGRGENFGDYIRPKWPAPGYLFALSPQRHSKHHMNYREIETIQPLADKFHLPINSDYPSSRMSSLTNHVFRSLHSGEMCGRLAVISWKHSEIPALAQRLGCGPIQGCPMDYSSMEFDAVWQLKFVFDVGRYGLPLPAGSGSGTGRGGGRRTKEEVGKKAKNKNKNKNKKQKQKQILQAQPPQPPRWKVFGSVQREGFDPLEFSARAGDYPLGGTSSGGRWIDTGVDGR